MSTIDLAAAAAVGILSGTGIVVAAFAVDLIRIPGRENPFARRLTESTDPVMAELDAVIAARYAAWSKGYAAGQAADLAKFRPDLLSGAHHRAMGDIPVPQLLREITQVKEKVRALREDRYQGGSHHPDETGLADQLQALTAEFQRRRMPTITGVTVSPLDRRLLALATDMVHDGREWPSHPLEHTLTVQER